MPVTTTANLPDSVKAILRDRFLHPHETDWYDVAERAARTWGQTPEEVGQFYGMMRNRKALPNTPALANAGRTSQMASACFVLPINDSLTDGPASIMQTLKDAAAVHKSGGGTGFSFGRIRGRGSLVASTGRPAPGAVNVLELYSDAIHRVTQAGMRPGANMGILPVDHPDIMEFLTVKNEEGRITNFNISVAMTDDFMRRVVSQRLSKPEYDVWNTIIEGMWLNGEPGVWFMDTTNNARLHPEIFEATNPCGEVPLRPYEACVLGSINLAAHVEDQHPMFGEPDWDYDALRLTIHTMVRMLDNIIDEQDYPLPEIEQEQKRYRKIGLGVMGWADALHKLGLRYGAQPSLDEAVKIAAFIEEESRAFSEELAKEKGPYPGYIEGGLGGAPGMLPYRRNLNTMVIAPTGTISRLGLCSFGIEPHMDVNEDGAFRSFIVGGQFTDRHFVDHKDWAFRPAAEVTLEQHVKMLAAWQTHTDQGVSKTINCPNATTQDEVAEAIIRAWKLRVKGLTMLREGSRQDVVIGTADCNGVVCAVPDVLNSKRAGVDRTQTDTLSAVDNKAPALV